MNQRLSGSLVLSKAITGFASFKSAQGLSDRTIDSYERHLQKWIQHQGDIPINQIISRDITAYLDWLRSEYVPHRFGKGNEPLSPKTLRNIWVTFSAFFTWATKEFQIPNPMVNVPAPRFTVAPVEPFTQDGVQAMLKVCVYSKEVQSGNRKSFVMRLPNGHRDQAILLLLIDTGLRAMELCSLRIRNVDLKTGKVEIEKGVSGGAKGGKGRVVYLGKATRRALWRYLADREDGENPDSFVFFGKRKPTIQSQLVTSIDSKHRGKGSGAERLSPSFLGSGYGVSDASCFVARLWSTINHLVTM